MPNHQKDTAKNSSFIFALTNFSQVAFQTKNLNIPGLSLGEVQFPGQERDITIPSNKVTSDPLVIDFLVTDSLDEWVDMVRWLANCSSVESSHEDFTETGEMTVLNSEHREVLRIRYNSCWPVNIGALQYSTEEETSITCSITLAYDNLELEIVKTGEIITP